MLSFINCTGYFELANIPPTLPAQLMIISGQLFLMNFFNLLKFNRSRLFLETVIIFFTPTFFRCLRTARPPFHCVQLYIF